MLPPPSGRGISAVTTHMPNGSSASFHGARSQMPSHVWSLVVIANCVCPGVAALRSLGVSHLILILLYVRVV